MKKVKLIMTVDQDTRLWNGELSSNMIRTLKGILDSAMKLEPEQVPAFLELATFLHFVKRKEYERENEEE
jgi:hypothetical protein